MTPEDGLQLLAVTKPAGATPRIHAYDFSTGTWTHRDAGWPEATISQPYWGFTRTLTDDELDDFADGLGGSDASRT